MKYPEITMEIVEKALIDYFGDKLTYEDLKKKILDGYSYRLKSEKLVINTGKGGVLMMIDTFEKTGLPASLAQSSISVFYAGEYYPLSSINVKENAENQIQKRDL